MTLFWVCSREFQISDDVNLLFVFQVRSVLHIPKDLWPCSCWRCIQHVSRQVIYTHIIAHIHFFVCIQHNCILQDSRCLLLMFYLNPQTWLVLLHPGVTFLTCWSRWTVYWGLKERCWWGTRWTSSTRLCRSLKVCDGSAEWQTTRTAPWSGRRLWSVWRLTGLV